MQIFFYKDLHLFIVPQWEFIDPYKIGEGLIHLNNHKHLGKSSLAYAEAELVKQSECSWKKRDVCNCCLL